MFRKLYLKTLSLADHPHAIKYLAGLSFIEAIFFPVPPDVILAPMTISNPDRTWYYATITMLFSVLGGIFGYLLGFYAYYTLVVPLLDFFNLTETYKHAFLWFDKWGGWVIVIAACAPIPYKVFTITAGALQMNFAVFVIASLIGRSARFFLVCSLFKAGNKYFAGWFRRRADAIGWGSLICIIVVLLIMIYQDLIF